MENRNYNAWVANKPFLNLSEAESKVFDSLLSTLNKSNVIYVHFKTYDPKKEIKLHCMFVGKMKGDPAMRVFAKRLDVETNDITAFDFEQIIDVRVNNGDWLPMRDEHISALRICDKPLLFW